MRITQLKKPLDSDPMGVPVGAAGIRGTGPQDSPSTQPRPHWMRHRIRYGLAAATLLGLLAAFLAHAWLHSGTVIPRARLQLATVTRGRFVRDVSADGLVVAAVSPTLFAIAPGTVSYAVRPGQAVRKGDLLATLDSPELANEYQRERATLDSLDAALARQQIEIRRQLMRSQQQTELSQVAINAAVRELKRSESAWDERVISERDYRRAIDDVSTARLNFEHARDSASLERDSLALELRTRRLERERQALVVSALQARIGALEVRSPVDGTIANLAVPEKTHVARDAPLLTVVDLSAFEVEFRVTESYAGAIRTGMAAELTLGGGTVPGEVTTISPEVRQNQVTGRVKFLRGQPRGLRQNERAAVRIVLEDRGDVLHFERGAFIDDATRAVYVVRGAEATRVPVELGAASVSEIEVLRGLAPGDVVVVSDTRDLNRVSEFAVAD